MTIYNLRYRNLLDPKDHTRKTDKTVKDFELYQVFLHNFFVSKRLDIPIIFIAYKKNLLI